MSPDTIICLGYVRVSTEQQAGEMQTSLADQEAAIGVLAARLGVEVGRWFREAGVSGATVEGRPAFVAMLAWCEAHPRAPTSRGLVLVLNDSRFGRFVEPEEATYWRHHLYRLGWIVRFAEGDEVEGDFRGVVRAIGSAQATEYRRNLIANVRRGMKGAADQGFWTREAPYGYRRRVVHPRGSERVLEIGQRKADNEKVRLTPYAEEAAVVRWAYGAYAGGGESLGTLAEALKRRVPSRRWSRTVVNAMLRNDAYRGAVIGGRRRDGGREIYGTEDAHEPLVSPDLWSAVQRRLEANARRGNGVPCHYLLSGIMRCVYCGEAYTGGGGGRSRSKNPARPYQRFYRDNGGISGACEGRIGTITRHLVDDAAIEIVASTITKPAVRSRIEREIEEALERAPGGLGATEAELRAVQREEEMRRERLTAAVADGTLLPAEASGQLERIRAVLADVEARRQSLRFRRRRARGARSERDRLLSTLLEFPALAARCSGAQLRDIVEPWIGLATFDKVRRTLTVGIRCVPALPSLLLYASPGRGSR